MWAIRHVVSVALSNAFDCLYLANGGVGSYRYEAISGHLSLSGAATPKIPMCHAERSEEARGGILVQGIPIGGVRHVDLRSGGTLA